MSAPIVVSGRSDFAVVDRLNRMEDRLGFALIAATLASGAGLIDGREPRSTRERRDWSQIEHTHTPKPLSKRRKRRLRGKAKDAPKAPQQGSIPHNEGEGS